MTSSEFLTSDVLDILFENRNKNYGAYILRKFYPERLTVALSAIIPIVFLLLAFRPDYAKDVLYKITPTNGDVTVSPHTILPPVPDPPKPTIRPAATPVATLKSSTYRISADATNTEVPTQTQLSGVHISNQTSSGVSPDFPQPDPQPETVPKPAVAPTPVFTVNAAPEFPGGSDAWMRFLSRNLRAPESLAGGEKKTVMVQFFVDTEGKVTDFSVVQSGGPEFDQEVIRVLRKMPKWKPALKNGQPVAITFTQPVTFMGLEE